MSADKAVERSHRPGNDWLGEAVLDENSAVPLYHQLLELLRQWLIDGDLRPGDPIPSELELCQRFRISRGTVRRALLTLANEGLIYRRQGRGSFVVRPRLRQQLARLVSFTECCLQRGMTPASRVITLETRRAPVAIARSLQLAPESPVIQLERVRFADGEPVCLDSVFVSQQLCPSLANHDFTSSSFLRVIAQEYRIILSRVSGWLRPVVAGARESRLLQVPKGSPLLLLETTISTQDDRPVVFSRELWRGDRTQYLLEATPGQPAQNA